MYKLKGDKKFAVMSISTIMFMCGVLISTYYYTKIKVYGDSGSNEIVAAEEPISDQLPDEEIAFLEDYVLDNGDLLSRFSHGMKVKIHIIILHQILVILVLKN